MKSREIISGNRKFVIKCSDQFAFQADWLLNVFKKVDEDNGPIKDATNIQVGWTIYTAFEQDGKLVFMAPDYLKNPFVDKTEDLTSSLSVQLQQNFIINKLGVAGTTALFQDKIVAAKGAIELENIYLERKKISGVGDSGWYLGPCNDSTETEDYEAFYIYQLLKVRPSLLQVLALPQNYLAVFNGDQIKEILDERDIAVWEV